MPYTPKDATPATVAASREAVAGYDMTDRQAFADAARSLIAPRLGPVASVDRASRFRPGVV
jgi:hypothetical protein